MASKTPSKLFCQTCVNDGIAYNARLVCTCSCLLEADTSHPGYRHFQPVCIYYLKNGCNGACGSEHYWEPCEHSQPQPQPQPQPQLREGASTFIPGPVDEVYDEEPEDSDAELEELRTQLTELKAEREEESDQNIIRDHEFNALVELLKAHGVSRDKISSATTDARTKASAEIAKKKASHKQSGGQPE